MPRRNIWRQGVLQVWVTRACDQTCFGCTQGSNLRGKPGMITVEQFATALDSLQAGEEGGYFGVVGMFGGNPCVHPKFEELCEVMRCRVPLEQRGLWSNHPRGHGAECRLTFNPRHSNINVHLDREAFDEWCRDWPEVVPFILGTDPAWPEATNYNPARIGDSRHSPPFVAMRDVIPDESERWSLIADCDINKYWSAMICVFRGQLRAFFCELAGAQAMLKQSVVDYPDTGLSVEPGWWKKGMDEFAGQVRKHCHECGVPLKRFGQLAIGGDHEEVSETFRDVYTPKVAGREVRVVETVRGDRHVERITDYVQNGGLS